MKKVATLTIILCLLFSVALSEGKGKEILFRDVPWGASPREVEGSFSERIYWQTAEYGSCFGMDYWTKGKGTVYKGDVCAEIKSDMDFSETIKVAGFDASMVDLRFAVVPGSAEPAFIMAEYLFAKGDLFDLFFDLLEKLSTLYGRKYAQNIGFSSAFEYYYVWNDADGNKISLYKHGDSVVSVRYISSKIDELLSVAESAQESAKKSSYDGL